MTFSNAFKRCFDILVVLIFSLLLSPLLLLVAILVKVTSKGSILFRQERLGKNGRVFKVFKFRTMFVNKKDFSVKETREFEFKGSDPRVTKLGFFLRASGLDELPQMINILLGDMSLVGPRPFYPPRYEPNPEFKKRLLVKPGITCIAVIKGGTKLSEQETLAYDMEYIKKANFLLDLKIIFKTAVLYFKKIYEAKKV